MAFAVEVSLVSGRTAVLDVEPDTLVDTLRERAQGALAVGRGRLLDSSGRLLDTKATVEESGLRCGDVLTLQLGQVEVAVTFRAVAAILGDGSVAAWGDPNMGGDCSCVQDRLLGLFQQLSMNGSPQRRFNDGVAWGTISA